MLFANTSCRVISVHSSLFPLDLFRYLVLPVKLRLWIPGRVHYDVRVHDEMILARRDEYDSGPNGLTLREGGKDYTRDMSFNFHRLPKYPRRVYKFSRGAPIPRDLLLVHRFSGHWCLEPRRDTSLACFVHFLNSYVSAQPSISKAEYLLRHPLGVV